MIQIGINGFGRIGKCVFLQLINNTNFKICALNAINININEIEDYLRYDSTHKYNQDIKVDIISHNEFKINHHCVKLLSDKNAKNLEWKIYNCEYMLDATGCFLTTEKCKEHDVNYVLITAPAKDLTPTFVYGVNHDLYNGEKIISASSCTTNSISPMLKLLNDNYGIHFCNFTTIHATTSSQYPVDSVNNPSRINRSILNNIIPHTTGASSSIISILPELKNKINGASVRVPVLSGSLLVVDIELINKNICLYDITELFLNHELFDIVYQINTKKLVSCDFITTKTPTILDVKASIEFGDGRFKLMLWYDNEWSYSAQLIRILEQMNIFNKSQTLPKITNTLNPKYYFENIEMNNKGVVARFDFNVPMINNVITDDFRILSAINTITKILDKCPKYLILTCHFGRPKNNSKDYSVKFLIPILEKYINKKIYFLEDGISEQSLNIIKKGAHNIYLLENLRFHEEETNYENMTNIEIENNNIIKLYRQFGDIFILDAFGCAHRKHMSICDIKKSGKTFCYGKLIQNEVKSLSSLIKNTNLKILAIIGGNKIKEKMPLINSIRKINNSTIYVSGGIASQYSDIHDNVFVMEDGYGNINLDETPMYISNIKNTHKNIYDIGYNGLNKLVELINNSDIIFWNGSLGIIEDDRYVIGSKQIVNCLEKMRNKKIIIGGGETSSLFNKNNNNIYISTGGGALLEYIENIILYNETIVGLEIFMK
jgi:glyceraldehyde 3-phosphate dehydrogenase